MTNGFPFSWERKAFPVHVIITLILGLWIVAVLSPRFVGFDDYMIIAIVATVLFPLQTVREIRTYEKTSRTALSLIQWLIATGYSCVVMGVLTFSLVMAISVRDSNIYFAPILQGAMLVPIASSVIALVFVMRPVFGWAWRRSTETS